MPTTKTTVYTILLLHTDTHAHGRVGNNKRIIGYRSYCMRAGSDNPRKRRAFVYTKPLTDGRKRRASTNTRILRVRTYYYYTVSVYRSQYIVWGQMQPIRVAEPSLK